MGIDPSDLFERHHLAILRFFRRVTGDRDLAEDLTQDVFVRVVKGIAKYRERGRATGWVFQIARSVLVDHHRKQRVQPARLPSEEAAAACAPPSQLVAFGVQQALDRLPHAERAVFLLREVGGLSYREVAAICHASEDGVGATLFRARRQLRQMLSGRLNMAAHRTLKKD